MTRPLFIDPTDPLGAPLPVVDATMSAGPLQEVDAVTFMQEATQPPTRPVQYPTLGRLVRVLVDPALNNGADTAPAVITRVVAVAADRSTVNLRVFLDATPGPAEWATSRYLWNDEETARAAGDLPVGGVSAHAFWPPRAG